ncbi:MAG: hypothetical protein QGG40_06680, partial [Myxococcota bacterium]|nr:hypothetical protein [Myxococcota bacterium]
MAWVVGAGAAVMTFLPREPPWRGYMGDSIGETDNHVWMAWRWLHPGGTPVVNLPEGMALPLMDPVNMLPFVPVWWMGQLVLDPPSAMVIGWNAMVAWNVALALFGGWMLSRTF